MSFEIVEKSQVNREITLTIEGEALRRAETRLVEQVRKTMVVNGFRKGKVPASVVRARAGASIAEDARREVIQEVAREAISSIENLLHVGEIEVVTPRTDDGGLVARVNAEVRPEVKVGEYKGIEVKVADVVVTDEDIDSALENMRQRHAVVKPVEDRTEVQDGDVVTCTLSAPNDAASKLCHAGERTLTVGRGDLNVELEKCLVGAKVGEPVQLTAQIGDAEPVVTCVVNEIKVRVLPELDDAFALDTGDAETLDGLKTVVRERLTKEREDARKNKIDEKICEKLRESSPIDMPEMYVRARAAQAIRLQLEQITRQQIGDEYIERIVNNIRESELVEYRTDYHNEIILNAIAEAEKIEVSEEDTLKEAIKWFGNVSEDQIKRWLKTNNAAQFVGDQVKRDRALEIVRDAAVVTPMTAEEIEAEKKTAEEAEKPQG